VLSNLGFRLMALEYRLRDLLRPPDWILRQVGVRPGMDVLDLGCGPGSFSLAAAGLVGPEGSVYAVDIHPLAIRRVGRAANRLGVSHLEGRTRAWTSRSSSTCCTRFESPAQPWRRSDVCSGSTGCSRWRITTWRKRPSCTR